MVGNVTIELAFGQQVAAEALKYSEARISLQKSRRYHWCRTLLFSVAAITISVRRERRQNRYVKCEAIDSNILVRTHAIHLRLDSQFNLSRLIIPIGIGI
jgi:hypothetical protein